MTFTCKIAGEPFPEIAWLKDGIEIEMDNRFTMTIDANGTCSLKITDAKVTDTGFYSCIVQNENGSDKTEANLSVRIQKSQSVSIREDLEMAEGPDFVKPLRDRSVPDGQDLELEVRVIGKPMPEIYWEKDGVELKPAGHIVGEIECVGAEIRFRLTVKGAGKDDAGEYTCKAINQHGQSSTKCNVTVDCKFENLKIQKFQFCGEIFFTAL